MVAAGAEHTAAVTEDGSLYGWGWGRYGNLGLGDRNDRLVPEKVSTVDVESRVLFFPPFSNINKTLKRGLRCRRCNKMNLINTRWKTQSINKIRTKKLQQMKNKCLELKEFLFLTIFVEGLKLFSRSCCLTVEKLYLTE